jgi:tetratricopeptide (TPR) repeat protein
VKGAAAGRFVVGLVVGAAVGFFAANLMTRSGTAPVPAAAPQAAAPAAAPEPALTDDEIARAVAAVESRPDDFEAQYKMGEALLRIADRPAEAVRYYERAAAIKPGAVEAHAGVADARFASALRASQNGVYDTALLDAAAASYERALALAPKTAGLHAALGMTRVVRRPPELDRAEREFRRALELEPANDLAKRGLEMAADVRKGEQ